MRQPHQLVHSRARVRGRYALMPLEGFPSSTIPGWIGAEVRVLAAPALGAGFVEHLIVLPGGGEGAFAPEEGIENFFYVLSGNGTFWDGNQKRAIAAGAFALAAVGRGLRLVAHDPMRVLVVRKRFESAPGVGDFAPVSGTESEIKAEHWAGSEHCRLQKLIPDEPTYDLAMNIFTFDPGYGLPVVETHVMEHGLFLLEGKGMYLLEKEWMEVERDDFIWMGPYCPQSFYATGPAPARYLYYKNVNRDVSP